MACDEVRNSTELINPGSLLNIHSKVDRRAIGLYESSERTVHVPCPDL
jgi:hypothetical protein